MTPLSTGGTISSRTFTARAMKDMLKKMPSSQAAQIRRMAKNVDEITEIGYYAALDMIATNYKTILIGLSRTNST